MSHHHPSANRRQRIVFARIGFVAILLLPACGNEDSSTVEETDSSIEWADDGFADFDDGVEIRPGDTWLDFLDFSLVTDYPTTNLPPEVERQLRQSLVWMRTSPLGWKKKDRIPAGMFQKVPESRRGMQVWQTRPASAMADRNGELRAWLDGNPMTVWRPETEDWPDAESNVAWMSQHATLFALTEGNEPPPSVQLEYQVKAADLVGSWEPRLRIGEGEDATFRPAPVASKLRQQSTLLSEVIDGLRLPAGAELQLPIRRLEASVLELAIAAFDQGFVDSEGSLEQRPQLSDGMTFVLEATVGTRTEELWRHHLPRDQVGVGFEWCQVDLAGLVGHSATLSLRIEAGEAGNAHFDYGIVGMLRFRGEARQSPEKPHVVVISLDTLRADRLSLYGYHRPTSPLLDAWAEQEAVVYDRASSTAPWTLPSTISILTGLAVSQHQVNGFGQSLPKAVKTIAGILRHHGYETAAYTGGGYLRPQFGLAKGFDRYYSGSSIRLWDHSCDWLRQRMHSESPLFLFLQTYRVHAPYKWNEHFIDDGYDGAFQGEDVTPATLAMWLDGSLDLTDADLRLFSDLYDGEVLGLDALLVPYLKFLDELFEGHRYLLIITSDHGEEFVEHGKLGHGQSLFEELMHVPLLVRFPEQDDRPRGRVAVPTSTLDIVPTILSEIGLPIPPWMSGRPLRGPLDATTPLVAERGNSQHRSIRIDNLKLIQDRGGKKQSLYDLINDPQERRNLASKQPDDTRRMSTALKDWLAQHPPVSEGQAEADLSDALRRELEELGYLEPEDSPTENGSQPPPER